MSNRFDGLYERDAQHAYFLAVAFAQCDASWVTLCRILTYQYVTTGLCLFGYLHGQVFADVNDEHGVFDETALPRLQEEGLAFQRSMEECSALMTWR